MINPDWARWIFASVAKYYREVATDISIPMYLEGTDQITADLTEYFELRIMGPQVFQSNKSNRLDIDINLLVTVAKSKPNNYRIHEIGGLLQSKVANIPICKIGSKPGDDNSQIFCLTLRNDQPVKWVFLGRIEKSTGLLQGVVDSRYRNSL